MVMKEATGVGSDFTVSRQVQFSLDLDESLTVKPDVVVRRHGKVVLAVDTKYKLEHSALDVYQVLAYAHALDIESVVLAVPGQEGTVRSRSIIKPPGRCRIIVHPINLSVPFARLAESTSDFCDRVLGEVVGEVR